MTTTLPPESPATFARRKAEESLAEIERMEQLYGEPPNTVYRQGVVHGLRRARLSLNAAIKRMED